MKFVAVGLVFALMVLGSSARVVLKEIVPKDKDTTETKVEVTLHVEDPLPDEEIDTTEEVIEDDSKLTLPERGARLLQLSPINQVTEYVKSVIPTGEKIRPMTRQFVGAVQGKQHCWEKVICQTGRMLSGFKQTPDFLDMVDKYGPNSVKEVMQIMRSSAVEGDDCTTLICNV